MLLHYTSIPFIILLHIIGLRDDTSYTFLYIYITIARYNNILQYSVISILSSTFPNSSQHFSKKSSPNEGEWRKNLEKEEVQDCPVILNYGRICIGDPNEGTCWPVSFVGAATHRPFGPARHSLIKRNQNVTSAMCMYTCR